jgi:hypothetical protein
MKITHFHILFSIAFSLQIFFCCAQRSGTQTATDSVQISVVENDSIKTLSPLTDNDKQPLAERKVSAHMLDSMRKDDEFWYVNYVRKKPEPEKPPKENFFESLFRKTWWKPLVWTLIITGFVAILIWFLSSGDMSIFRRAPKKIKEKKADEETQDIYNIDFDKAITAAINEGNFRLAVRLQYLQLLRLLSDKNIIDFNPHRPNSDYVMQLFGTNYYPDFFRITRYFEYAWYGGFPVSASAFDRIRGDVMQFKNRVA